MTQKKLHPSVEKFKGFVKTHPAIVQEVRSGKSTWQELYEDWYLLGEEDEKWDAFRAEGVNTNGNSKSDNEKEKNDWMSQALGMMKKMDATQMQVYINNLSQALGAIQGLISQFQGSGPVSSPPPKSPEGPKHPFMFRKD
ncbi:MAG: YlbD family protein [Bacillota bacterium]|nr:YlbD family protein [Bacillota bacterium]